MNKIKVNYRGSEIKRKLKGNITRALKYIDKAEEAEIMKDNKLLEKNYIDSLKIRHKRGHLFLVIQTYLNYLIDGGDMDLLDIIEITNKNIEKYYTKELAKLDLYINLKIKN